MDKRHYVSALRLNMVHTALRYAAGEREQPYTGRELPAEYGSKESVWFAAELMSPGELPR